MRTHDIRRPVLAGRLAAALLLATALGGCSAALSSTSPRPTSESTAPAASPSPDGGVSPTPTSTAMAGASTTTVVPAKPSPTADVVAPTATPTPTPGPTASPPPNTDCGALALTPSLRSGAFLETAPLPAGAGAAVEVIAGRTSEAPLDEFMQSRDFLENAPEWTGRWEGLVPVLVPGGADGVRLDTGAPVAPCTVQVTVERTGQGANGEGVGAGPIRLRFTDGTEVVLGPERCFWRGFSGPGLGSVTCHGARQPEWSNLLVWVRFSFRESDIVTPG